jgi:hypothetical protein
MIEVRTVPVFALDLDLEAPGLHYKFELGSEAKRLSVGPGIVDILVAFLKQQPLPQSLENYTTKLKVADGAGAIHIMPAGTAPSGEYWRLLSQVNWYEIFYGKQPTGVPFFLDLKERIRASYNPDFLLIDARTGITEMGGIATTLLPDSVVCLALASVEHLEGLRAVTLSPHAGRGRCGCVAGTRFYFVIASEAKQSSPRRVFWIASSRSLLSGRPLRAGPVGSSQ